MPHVLIVLGPGAAERAVNNSFGFMKAHGNIALPLQKFAPASIQLHSAGVTSVPMVHSFLRSSNRPTDVRPSQTGK
jgi:hypothetical protein